MDESIINGTHEHHDPGYASFVSMMLVHHIHNNPIIIVLVDISIKEMKEIRRIRKKVVREQALRNSGKSESTSNIVSINVAVEEEGFAQLASLKSNPVFSRKVQVVFRWWLVVALHNNPSLRQYRKLRLPSESSKDQNIELKTINDNITISEPQNTN